MQAWRVEVSVRPGLPDPAGVAAGSALREAGLEFQGAIQSRRGYLLGDELTREQVEAFAREVLVDPIQEESRIFAPAEATDTEPGRISVLPLPGVTDPVARSVQKALVDSDLPEAPTGTYQVYLAEDVAAAALVAAAEESLANQVIQRVIAERVPQNMPGPGGEPDLATHEIPLEGLDEDALCKISTEGGLALDGTEMKFFSSSWPSVYNRSPTIDTFE